jgi:outer membrane protein assembly factor BamB
MKMPFFGSNSAGDVAPKVARSAPLLKLLGLPVCAFLFAGATLAADLPAPAEYRANWPRFRGPDGSGVYPADKVPLTCDPKAGTNVAWSVPVPSPGYGSPVIWGDRVFMSGGNEDKREVMCFDLASGKVLWEREVPKSAEAGDEKIPVPEQCGMAAGTVATDGQRVYAIFANGTLAAFNFDGTVAWAKNLGNPRNEYGFATSLVTWQDRVIVQFDQGAAEDNLSKIYAFDGATGNVAWQKQRPVGQSWATPIIIEPDGKAQLITCSLPLTIAYSPKDGAEIWRAECLDGLVTPSPIFAAGTLFVVNPSNKLQAIRPDGEGDVTNSNLGWGVEDGIPDVTSPVSNGELIFLLDSGGTLTCYDAKDGKKQWQQDLMEECNASPSIAGSTVYVVTRKGTLIAVAAARQFKELGRSSLGEDVFASPAFAQNKILIRGVKNLFCIGEKK